MLVAPAFFASNMVFGRATIPAVAPFTLMALGDAPPEHWPEPAQHLPRPPNNHLSYAITWYGLAAALVAVFVALARGRLRKERRTPEA